MNDNNVKTTAPLDEQEPKPMIEVQNVDMVFNIANEQLNSLKEYFIALVRGKLFFREFKALEDISFTVNRGDVYGIVGTNGSGKSTLLKIIAGVLEPTKGTCEISGTIAPLIELGAGFDPELTARENVYLNGSLLGYSKKFIDEHFDAIVDFAEVRDFIDMPLKNYSSGMVARIAFAIATATTPDILVVDEALSVGDFMFQEKCERRINDLVKNHGTTLLFVSHSIDQVERVCEKALWIEKGHKRLEGSVEDVCFAYRNMDYTDFVVSNGIVEQRPTTVDELRNSVTIENIVEALWRCTGAPEIVRDNAETNVSSARAWARSHGIIPADLDAFYASTATRQDMADLIHQFAVWRKPSVSEFEPIDPSAFSDELPAQDSQRLSAEWCVSHGLMSGIPGQDGSLALAMQEPATFIGLSKMITRLYKRVFSYPHDVNLTDWYVLPGYFDYVIENGYMSGHADGSFAPNSPITRGQALTVLWRCAGSPEVGAELPFEDVEESDYFHKPVAWALNTGVIKEKGSHFRPEESIARQDLALVMHRYVALEAGKAAGTKADLSRFADVVQLPATHSTAMAWAIGNGLLETFVSDDGHRQLKPSDSASRASMVKAIAVVQRDILGR